MVAKLNRSKSLRRSRRTIRSKRAIRSRRATRSKRVKRSRKVRRSRNNRKSRIKRGGGNPELGHYIKLLKAYINLTNNFVKVYGDAFKSGNKETQLVLAPDIYKLINDKSNLENLLEKLNTEDGKRIVENYGKMDQATFLKDLGISELLIEHINDLHADTDLKY